jgi:hypothetical protein
VTTIQISGFDASLEGAKEENVKFPDEETKTWDIFVPFGKIVHLHWLGQWDVIAISTKWGLLEVAHHWLGGGEPCEKGGCIYPEGVFQVWDKIPQDIFPRVAAIWEKSYPEMWHDSDAVVLSVPEFALAAD